VKILVDTHAYIWWGIDPARLSTRAAEALSSSENEVYVSVVSLWEIMIKSKLGKLELPVPLQIYMARQREENLVQTLSVTEAHVYAHATLSDLHKDPFDRMLVAQALAERLTLVTRDARIRDYGLPTLW
jgi:PIN domain nuclease of toxin-antitoxin system